MRTALPSVLCPRDSDPARIPANSSGTTCSSSIATSHRTGRMNRSPLERQYMLFGQNLVSPAAFLADNGREVLAFRCIDPVDFRKIQINFFGKGVCRGSWLSVVKGNFHRWPGDLLFGVGLLTGYPRG